jgi:hypothetical protein
LATIDLDIELNSSRQHGYLYPILIGILAFLVIAGPRFLDPTNVAWLVGGDPLQHYLGWAFYRNGPWTWPIGLNPLYGMEFSNSIVFTDSIPLLAIPFKAISQFLPYPFQYLGIWVLLCFVLQAYFAFRLIRLITSSIAIQCLGSIFFLFSPPLIFRLSLHESLMGHFIILAALYLNLKPINEGAEAKKKYSHILAWIVLLSIAALTHFYLAVMALVLWLADLFRRAFVLKRISFKGAFIEVMLVLGVMAFVTWQAGYFAIGGASGATRGFGDFRTNLLALFNSRGWSYFIRPIPLRDAVEAATGEGFQYLGAGSLLLLFSAIYAAIKARLDFTQSLCLTWKNYPFLIGALVVLALISFSNHIGFGPWNLTVPLPEFVTNLMALVRSSSRLFWPTYYTILLIILYVILKSYRTKNVLILLGIAAIMQVVDTSAGWLAIKEKVSLSSSNQFKTVLQNPFWAGAGQTYQSVVINDVHGNWEDFGIYASSNKMATNITHLARIDESKRTAFTQMITHQLYSGPLNPNNLYIFREWKSAPDKLIYNSIKYNPEVDLLASIDGFNLLAPGWKTCKSCAPVDGLYELRQLAPTLAIGELAHFTKAGDGRAKYMLNGWGYTEDWGTWAIQQVAQVVLPMPEGDPSKLIIKANAFLSPTHAEQVVDIAVNGARVADHMVLNKAQGNSLEVKLPKGIKTPGEPVLIEFRSLDTISPKSAGLSADERKLGIGLISIQFAR